jgi:hypothetical protein
VWRSTDAGLTWAPASFAPGPISILRVDPASASTVWAGTDSGLFRSTDGGRTWSKVLDQGYIAAIALSPSSPSVIYAGSLVYGAFRSVDGGETWVPLPSLGTPVGIVTIEISSLAVDPTDARRVFASSRPVFHGLGRPPELPSLYRSTDGGDSWTPVLTAGGFRILVAPTSPPTMYEVGLFSVYRSDDGGDSWSLKAASSPVGASDVTIDLSDPSTLYGATSSGISRLTVDPATLVLGGGRFEVTTVFRNALRSGSAQFTGLSENAGAFWFFTPNNVEVVIKILDGRPVNGHFWVFGAALTNVEYDVTIKDTVTRAIWIHHNEAGTLKSFADIEAF